MSAIENINDQNWEEFTSSGLAVLLVTESWCPHCKEWKEELDAYLTQGAETGGCRFGTVILDSDDVEAFKKANDPWIQIIDGFPFTVIYSQGEPQTSFYGKGVDRLLNRLKRFSEA